jgi:hypothetical protein
MWGTLSDERMGLSFTITTGPRQELATIHVCYCLRFETSLFVASYDTHDYGGGIRPRLRTLLAEWPQLHSLQPLLHGQSIKHRFQQYLCCCVRIRFSGNMCRDSLPRIGRCLFAYLAVIIQQELYTL